jgi:serine/threonine-protein kinase HipA
MSECGAFGLQPAQAAQEVAAVIGVVNIWRTHFVQIGVTAGDIEHLATFIDGDVLLQQRRSFDPRRYTRAGGKVARSARRGPFSDESR